MQARIFYNKASLKNFTVHHWLLLSCFFSCVLLAARVLITGQVTYIFMTWNLFLGFIPYAISQFLSWKPAWIESRIKLLLCLLVWLLFIPNTFYILTDLFHLEKFDTAPKWFDLLLLFSFAWNGLLLGILSIRRVELILQMVSGKGFSLFIVFTVMWLNAFGIYLGRYLRFNSWDVIARPLSLIGEMVELLFHPLQNKMEWGMITVYAVFITLLYLTVRKLADGYADVNNH